MERIEQFEKMLSEIQRKYRTTLEKMEKLKSEGKNKTVTYRQLRVRSIIRTSLKARIFRAFRRFGLARRQPCFTLSHQKSSKNYLL